MLSTELLTSVLQEELQKNGSVLDMILNWKKSDCT